jgi:hypothetical protein
MVRRLRFEPVIGREAREAREAKAAKNGDFETGSSTWRLHKGLHTHRTMAIVQVQAKQKAQICGAFAEPSDGLEPSTPSLPSSNEAGTAGKRGSRRPKKSRKSEESAEDE